MLSEFVEMVHRTESMSYLVLRARDDGSVDIDKLNSDFLKIKGYIA